MKSTHKNSVWAGIWNQQQLWMLCIRRKDFYVTLQYSKSTLNQWPRQQFCFKPALTWSLSKRIKIPLSPPPTYFQRAFHCVYEQGSSLPVFPHCTIGFPRASLAAPALLESRVYSSPPLSASRWGGGLWWGLDATECQCQKWPFSWKSGTGVRHCLCKKERRCFFIFFLSLSGRLYLNWWPLALSGLASARSFLRIDFSISSLTYIVAPSPLHHVPLVITGLSQHF